MRIVLIYSFVTVLGIAIFFGVERYKQLDAAMRILIVYLIGQLVSELFLYITAELGQKELHSMFMNTYIVIDAIIKGLFFIYAINPSRHKTLAIINLLLWPAIGGINILFFQSAIATQTNFIILESFGIITLSLYYIHWLLRKDIVQNVFAYPHFWIAIIWLITWGLHLFFWGVVVRLFNNHWQYINIAMHLQVAINVVAHAGMAIILYFYPKLIKQTAAHT